MTDTIFTDDVIIEGSQDIEQLRVQGHTTQDNPLQTWENNASDLLAQVTGDGRLIVGDADASPDSLIEAHQTDDSLTKPNRGFHSLGQVSGTLSALVQWIVGELELKGSDAIDALHIALRIRASNLNTGTPTSSAELRGADIEVINDTDASDDPLTKVTGLQVGVTNASGKTITDAVGLKVKMDNDGTITNPFSIYTEGDGPVHFEDYIEVKKPASTPGTPDTDFIRVYPGDDGKLYAKNSDGTEFDLTGGSAVIDNPSINDIRLSISSSDPIPAPGSTGTSIYLHPYEGEQISLYDTVTSKFIPHAITSPITFDMTAAGALGGNQVPFMPQDIFLAWDAVNNVFLKKVIPWASAPIQKSVTNITNASPPVLTVGASHGFAVNDLVVLQDVTGGASSLANKLYRIVATASTTVSLGDLGAVNIAAPGGTSTNGTLYKITPQTSRGTALTTLRGVKTYHDTGTGNYYKLVGTVAAGAVKETIYDTLQFPFVYNLYKQQMREIGTVEPTDVLVDWNVQTTANTPSGARAMGNRYQERQWFLTGADNQFVESELMMMAVRPTVASLTTGYVLHHSLDAIAQWAVNDTNFNALAEYVLTSEPATAANADVYYLYPRSKYERQVASGMHFFQPMEYVYNSGANNWTVYKSSTAANIRFKGGFRGKYLR